MIFRACTAIVALLLLASGCTTTAAQPEAYVTERGPVVAVVDGDTIDVDADGERVRVRLIGLDAPEVGRDGAASDCYAEEARDFLNELLYGRDVELLTDPSQDDVDRYGRLLRHVSIDGDSAALLAIAGGAATEYTYAEAYDGQAEHLAAEADARDAGAGLWGQC